MFFQVCHKQFGVRCGHSGFHGCALGLEVVVSVVFQVSISSIRQIRYDLGGWGIWKLVSVQGLSAPCHPSVWGDVSV